MQLAIHLNFNGNCEEAFQFYARHLGGKIIMLTRYRGTPMESHMSGDAADKIIHASMLLGDTTLMGADPPPGNYEAPRGVSVTLGITDVTEAERIFSALSDQGTVQMPLQKTFWAERFGMLRDRFGVPWMINCTQAAS